MVMINMVNGTELKKGGLNSLAMVMVGGGAAVLLAQLDADPINWARVGLGGIVIVVGLILPVIREIMKEGMRRQQEALEEHGDVIEPEDIETDEEAVYDGMTTADDYDTDEEQGESDGEEA